MQAVILAAGMGKRLGNLTQGNTKCMVEVNGVSLIDRMLSQLLVLPLSRIVIVIGYKGDKLKNYIQEHYPDRQIEFVENPIYDKTNNIYSLYLAKTKLEEEDTLLLESDLIFEESALRMLLDSPEKNLALVAKYETWMDGTMVRIDENNNILNFVPKKAFQFKNTDVYYKTVNIYKFSKEFLHKQYIPFLEAYTKALGNNEYYEQVLRVITVLDQCGLKALPLQGQKWYEIDDIQDLDIAETLFADNDTKLQRYQRRFGGYWRFPNLLDFCYLVNPYYPSEKMKEELKANFDVLLTEYPSGMAVNSLLAGKYFGVNQEYICVGNGAAELIKSLMENLTGNIGVVYPTFEEYPNRKDDSKIVPFIPENRDYAYSADDLMCFYGDKDVQNLLIVNPDNPSGNYIPMADLIVLSAWAKERNIRLIIDESFVDFAQGGLESSLLNNEILETNSNLVVVKSISKSYGVPGLRLGVLACSDKDFIAWMKKDVAIWNINSFGEFYMQIFGKYEKDYFSACRKFMAERERFFKALAGVTYLRVIPSQANYFLCEITSKYTSNELTRLLLERYNILIKDCGSKKAFTKGEYIRIAVRDQEDNDCLVDALLSL